MVLCILIASAAGCSGGAPLVAPPDTSTGVPVVCGAVEDLAIAVSNRLEESGEQAAPASDEALDAAIAAVKVDAPAEIDEALATMAAGDDVRSSAATVSTWAVETCGIDPFAVPVSSGVTTGSERVEGVRDWQWVVDQVRTVTPDASWLYQQATAVIATDATVGISVAVRWPDDDDRVLDVCRDVVRALSASADGLPVRVRVSRSADLSGAASDGEGSCDETPPSA